MKKMITYTSFMLAALCAVGNISAASRNLATTLAETGHVQSRKDDVTINVGDEQAEGTNVLTVSFATPAEAKSYGALVRLKFVGQYDDGDNPGTYLAFEGLYSVSTDYYGGILVEEFSVHSNAEGTEGTLTTARGALEGVLSGQESSVFLRLKEGGFNATSATGCITYEVVAMPGQVVNIT